MEEVRANLDLTAKSLLLGMSAPYPTVSCWRATFAVL